MIIKNEMLKNLKRKEKYIKKLIQKGEIEEASWEKKKMKNFYAPWIYAEIIK